MSHSRKKTRFLPPILHHLLHSDEQVNTKLQKVNSTTVNRIAWAVKVASRYIPGARCLAQALTTQVLLNQSSCSSNLCIGVARGKQGQLLAHAWVESQGKIVIGDLGKMTLYTPLPLQQAERCKRDRWHLFL